MACRVAFVLEQTLGHVTHGRNLRRVVEQDQRIAPAWLDVPYEAPDHWSQLPLVRRNWTLRAGLRARSRLHTLAAPPEVLFIHTQVAAQLCGDWLRRVPTIVSLDATPDDSRSARTPTRLPGASLADRAKRRWTAGVLRAARRLVAWNEWTKRSLIRDYGLPEAQIVVIPPGVDLEQWRPADKPAPRKPRVLFVGGDIERKGGPLLLEVFHRRFAQRCELDLVTQSPGVVSHGPLRVHRGLAANSPQLRALYAAADLFVLPTTWDCMPLAILEAMASGLPVIAACVGAIDEQVADGETGLLIPPRDAAALTHALDALLDNPARRTALGSAGRRRTEECFDARKNYGELIELALGCASVTLAAPVARHPAT